MEVAFSGVHADMYPIVAPFELRAGIALFSPSTLFYTDGSLMDRVAGFTVHHSIKCNIAAIRMAMDHIEN
jgi:ribonuclease HI